MRGLPRSWSMVSLLVLCALLSALLRAPLSAAQSGLVYFCWLSFSDPQASSGAAWSESISGTMMVNWAQFGPYAPSVYKAPIQSITGTRTYTTAGSTLTTAISMGAAGTDGSNNQALVFIHNNSRPGDDSRQLDGTGITFALAQAQPLAGTTNAVSTVTIKWSTTAGKLGGLVEVSGGTSGQYSQYTSWSPQINGSVDTTALPQCQAQTTAASLVYTFCVQCFASDYSTGNWQMQHMGIMSLSPPLGQVVTRATHQEFDSDSVMLGVVGVRWFQQAPVYYTDVDYPPTTSVITGLQGVTDGDGGPDNLLSFAAPWLDGNGYTYNIYPAQPLGNFAGNYTDINFYYNGYGVGWGNYREVNEPNHESVCSFEQSSYTYRPYVLGADPAATCAATITPPKVFGFCALMFDNTASLQWGISYSGYITTTGLPFTDLAYTGLPVYFTTAARGVRTYTNYMSGYKETANIVFMQPQGGDAGTDNLFYYPSMSPFSQISWNRNGLSWTFDRNVTVAGTTTTYPDLNLYYNSRLRETNDNTANGVGGGYHEDIGCIGQFTVVPWTGAAPACPLPSSVPACPTAPQSFDFCYVAYGANNQWSVAISAVLTGSPFQLDYGGSGGGYREYTNVLSVTKGTRTSYDSGLNPTSVTINSVNGGGLLYSVSSPYTFLSPGALLNSSGLTFQLASAASIVGTASSSTVNLYSPAIGQYQENVGTAPTYTYMRHTFLSSAGQRACQPSYAPAGCAASAANLPAGSLSMQVTLTSPSWSTVGASPVFGMQLMEDLAYSVGTGQLWALPLLSCASAAASGSNSVVTILVSNAAGNATQVASALQAAVSAGGLTTTQSAAVATTAIGALSAAGSSACSSSQSGGGGGSGLSGGQIAGIVIGSVVGGMLLLAICIALTMSLSRNGSNKQQRVPSSEESKISRREAEMTETSNNRA